MDINGRKTAYPNLDHLSTEELTRLLCGMESEDPDVGLILQAMEVIRSREAQTEQPDVDAAWKEFQEEYQGGGDVFRFDTDPSGEQAVAATGRTPRRMLLRIAVIAAVLLLLIGTGSAFGVEFFRTVASWTSETFRFASLDAAVSGQIIPEADPYSELREAVSAHTDAAVIPTWAPEGTVLLDDIEEVDRTACTSIVGRFRCEQGEFCILVQIYDSPQEFDATTYQKDGAEIEKIEISGVTHYLIKNTDSTAVVWVSGQVKCYIYGTLTAEDLSRMVGSIYKE